MQFFIIILLICLVIFLFSLYTFSHDDFILLRRNVSTDDVFNYAFGVSFFALFFSRVFYVVLNPKPVFLNPLGFILFPYFPGLSFLGGVIGGLIFLAILIRKPSFPLSRISDFLTLSFLSAMPFGFMGYMLLSRNFSKLLIAEALIYLGFLFLALTILIKRFIRSGKEDGIVTSLFLILFSTMSFIQNLIYKVRILRFDNIFYLLIFFISVVILLKLLLSGRTFVKKWI